MNRKTTVLLLATLLLGASAGVAATADDVTKALEQALKARVAQQEQDYKGFNPHLTAEQMNEIPALLNGVLERLHDAGYESLSLADVGDGLMMYFEGVNFTEGRYTTDHVQRITGDGIFMPEGDFYQHALMYSLTKVLPAHAHSFIYRAQEHPPVVNWKVFHYVCQDYMEDTYLLLQVLQKCEWETFKGVMGNLM